MVLLLEEILSSKSSNKGYRSSFDENLIENSNNLGKYFMSELEKIDSKIIKEVRGKGFGLV